MSTCSYELADVVALKYNSSLHNCVVPHQRLTAIITPVPKLPNPGFLSDFLPILVMPILNRTIKKLVVSRWLQSATPHLISD